MVKIVLLCVCIFSNEGFNGKEVQESLCPADLVGLGISRILKKKKDLYAQTKTRLFLPFKQHQFNLAFIFSDLKSLIK